MVAGVYYPGRIPQVHVHIATTGQVREELLKGVIYQKHDSLRIQAEVEVV